MSELQDKLTLDNSDYLRKLKQVDSAVDKLTGDSIDNFDSIQDALANLSKRADSLASKVKEVGGEVDQAGRQAAGAGSNFGSMFNSILGAATAATAVIGGLVAAIGLTISQANSALPGIAAKREFGDLAATAGQSTDELLAQLKRATDGTVSETELMQAALKNTQGELKELSQQRFGLDPSELSDSQRELLLVQAALQGVRKEFKLMGDNTDTSGRAFEQIKAQAADMSQNVAESFFILADRGSAAILGLTNALIGPEGLFPVLEARSSIFQETAVKASSAFLAAGATIAKRVIDLKNLFTGNLSIGEFLDPGRAVEQFTTAFDQAMEKAKADYSEIFNPSEGARPIEDFFNGAKESAAKGVDDLSKEFARLGEERDQALKDFAESSQDAATDYQRDLLKIETEFERKRSDILLDAARDREKAARDNLNKLADIRKDAARDAAKDELDYERKLEDIDRKYQEDRLEGERENRQKWLGIEVDYRRQIQDITRQADSDLEDAANKRDAVQFLAILKKKNQDLTTAQQDRARSIEDLRVETAQRSEELARRRELERESARIAYQREREDSAVALQQAIEDQNTAYERQLENINIAEQQKLADLQTWRKREQEDAKTSYEQSLADLQLKLDRELETLRAGNAALEDEAARHAAEMAATAATQPSTTAGKKSSGGQKSGGATKTTIGTPFAGFADGGFVAASRPIVVGERGPELFIPNRTGQIVPNERMPQSMFTSAPTVQNNITSNKTASLGGLLDPSSLDSVLASKIENTLLRILDRIG